MIKAIRYIGLNSYCSKMYTYSGYFYAGEIYSSNKKPEYNWPQALVTKECWLDVKTEGIVEFFLDSDGKVDIFLGFERSR